MCFLLPALMMLSDIPYTISLTIPHPLTSRSLQKQQQRRMISTEVSLSTEGNDVNGAASIPSSNTPTTGSSDTNNERQGLYGTTLNMPSTYVRCGKCQTAYAISVDDLGTRGGRRLECTVCTHSWFQTKDRLLTLTPEFELSALPERDVERIQNNIQEGKAAKYMGEKKLYVGNLAFQCHEDDLYEIFGQYGDVGEVNMIRDETGRPRGFAFVTMRTEEGGEKAIAAADGMMIRGRNIAVRESNS
jgi:predicted Zn finger-like uncharacterized protein